MNLKKVVVDVTPFHCTDLPVNGPTSMADVVGMMTMMLTNSSVTLSYGIC